MRRLALLFGLLTACGGDDGHPLYTDCPEDASEACDSHQCYTVGSSGGRGFCTTTCTAAASPSSECPGGGACILQAPHMGYCFQRCTTARDCTFSHASCDLARVCSNTP